MRGKYFHIICVTCLHVLIIKKNHDIVYLADILGHSSVDTTRIYTSISIKEHEKVLEDMELTF